MIAVWLPGRASKLTPSLKFDYLIRTNGATAVSTSTLRNDGTSYTTGYALYDGLLRKRQSQGPAPGGGRVLTDTFYDSRGLVTATDSDYYNEDDPGTTLYTPKRSADVPRQDADDVQRDGMADRADPSRARQREVAHDHRVRR